MMNYYTCANTADGFIDFTENNIFDIKTKIQLICDNMFIRNHIFDSLNNGCEKIISVGSFERMEGIILRDKDIAVVKSCTNPDRIYKIEFCEDYSCDYETISVSYEKMFEALKKAKKVHDEWEKIYIRNMDFHMLDRFCDDTIKNLTEKYTATGSGKTYKRFFATSTVEGVKNHIDSLTADLKKRYFIKGRPGTGKSTFLKKLSAELKSKGFDVEEYYCSLDSKSFDMVVSRELSFCVFDSTAPHEKNPERKADEILDFYLNAGLSGIDEKYSNELNDISKQYKNHIYEGMLNFEKAWYIKEQCDRQNFVKTDAKKLEEQITKLHEEITGEIKSL